MGAQPVGDLCPFSVVQQAAGFGDVLAAQLECNLDDSDPSALPGG
jgi:hypothetical protein